MTWHVAVIAPRKEASVVSELIALGMDAYCPMQARFQKVAKRNRRRIESPIIPGYVFVQIEGPFQLASAEATEGLTDFLRIWRQRDGEFVNVPAEIEDSTWIWDTRAREATGEFDFTIDRSPKCRPGDRIRIVAGAFADRLAVIQREANKREWKVDLVTTGPALPAITVSKSSVEVERAA